MFTSAIHILTILHRYNPLWSMVNRSYSLLKYSIFQYHLFIFYIVISTTCTGVSITRASVCIVHTVVRATRSVVCIIGTVAQATRAVVCNTHTVVCNTGAAARITRTHIAIPYIPLLTLFTPRRIRWRMQ